jgi:hypothetical protein
VKMKLLYAGDRGTVLGRRAKGPGLEGTDHAGFNAITKGTQNSKIGDLAAGVDGHIHHHVALHPVWEYREIRRRARGVGRESYLDRAIAPGVGAPS